MNKFNNFNYIIKNKLINNYWAHALHEIFVISFVPASSLMCGHLPKLNLNSGVILSLHCWHFAFLFYVN